MLIRYKIEYWNEISGVLEQECGITSGTDLGDGVNRIVDWYGKDNIVSVEVYELMEVLPDEELADMVKE